MYTSVTLLAVGEASPEENCRQSETLILPKLRPEFVHFLELQGTIGGLFPTTLHWPPDTQVTAQQSGLDTRVCIGICTIQDSLVPPVLKSPELNKPSILQTDVSDRGVEG